MVVKPGSWIPKEEPKATKPKKAFVLKPHLTDRPLAGNSELKKLRKNLNKPTDHTL